MTISSVVHSVLSGSGLHGTAHRGGDPRDPGGVAESPEAAALWRCETYRRSVPTADLVLPGGLLRNALIAKWVRDRGLSVEVRTGEELAVALAASVRPAQLIVDAHSLSESELRATVNLHPGRVVVSTAEHVAVLADAVERGPQRIGVQVGRAYGFQVDTAAFDGAIESILGERSLALLGLHCDLGDREDDFDDCVVAVSDMILEMVRIRRHHDIVLTRLGLGGGCLAPADGLPRLAEQIDEALDDACARLRFPRPRVDIAPGMALVA